MLSGRLLVLRPGAIGDTLLTLPALLALRRRFPDMLIEVAGNATALPLAEAAGVVDRWLSFDDARVTRLFVPAPPPPTDAFLGLSAAVAWCADPDGMLAAGLQARGARPVIVAPSRPPASTPMHVAAYLLESLGRPTAALTMRDAVHGTAHPTVSPPDAALPRIVPPVWAVEQADAALRAAGISGLPFLAVQPGSGSAGKNWPAEQFAATIEAVRVRLGLPSVVLAGPADTAVVQRLGHVTARPLTVLADLPLLVVASVLLRARAYLGNDSGLAHLAGQLGVPTLALFGPTDPVLWQPLGPRVIVLRAQPLTDVSVEAVLTALVPLLAP
jgi:heptosyltransferase-3